jgi:hypothetical protein
VIAALLGPGLAAPAGGEERRGYWGGHSHSHSYYGHGYYYGHYPYYGYGYPYYTYPYYGYYDPWYDPYRYERRRADPPSGVLWDGADAAARYRSESDGLGFAALRERRFVVAVRIFSDEAEQNPMQGLPRIGKALALAQLGDLAGGVSTLRAAVSRHAAAVHTVPVDDALRGQLGQLLAAYAAPPPDAGVGPADAAFARAFFHVLLDDLPAAREELDVSLRGGGDGPSAASLYRVIVVAGRDGLRHGA